MNTYNGDTMTRDAGFLGPLQLAKGSHRRGTEMCAMEAASYLAGERHSDKPQCVSPVIGEFMRSWNDALSDTDRQILKPWIVRCLHTNTGAQDDETRAWLAADWLVRECAPAWLDLAGLAERATELRNLPALTSSEIAVAVQSAIEHARHDATVAWDAAGAATARAAAWDAAWDAAWAAVWGWAATGVAARDAAGVTAPNAAWDTARDAAWAAARAAAPDAAWERLAPTVKHLQASAFGLLERMIAVGTVVERAPLGQPAVHGAA